MSRQKGDIMRDILISLKPYYYYLIGERIKKVEVRKSYPKAEDWSKSGWFYMSRDEKSFAKIPKEFQEKYRKHFGKVGMRFVCPKISHWWWSSYDGYFNDGGEYNITDEELKVGAENLIMYYYIQQWDGKLPETMLGEDSNTLLDITK